MKQILFILSMLMVLTYSCKKKDTGKTTSDDTISPQISITSPFIPYDTLINNDTFQVLQKFKINSQIHIKATITDNIDLDSIVLMLKDTATGSTYYFRKIYYTTASTFTIDTSFNSGSNAVAQPPFRAVTIEAFDFTKNGASLTREYVISNN